MRAAPLCLLMACAIFSLYVVQRNHGALEAFSQRLSRVDDGLVGLDTKLNSLRVEIQIALLDALKQRIDR